MQQQSPSKCICRSALVLTILAVAISSCSQPVQGDTPSQANAFRGEVYRSLDESLVVTMTSADELEVSRDGVNLICKYTRQATAIRVVETMMGASQAVYYQIIPDGIRGPSGLVLYAPKALAIAIANRDKENRDRAAAMAEARRKADVAAATLQAEDARHKALFEDSQIAREAIGTFRGYYQEVTLTDAGIKPDPTKKDWLVWYGILGEADPTTINEIDSNPFHPSSVRIFEVNIPSFWEPQRWIKRPVLASEIGNSRHGSFTAVFGDRAEAERFREAANKARSAWRAKWSELVNYR